MDLSARAATFLLFSVVLSCACLAAQEPPSKGDAVLLSFDWPPGMKGRVEGSFTQVRRVGDAPDSTSVLYEYDLQVLGQRDSRLVTFDGHRFPQMPGETGAGEEMAGLVGALSPDMVVSKEGELLRITNLEKMIETVRRVLAPLARELDSRALDDFYGALLTEEVFFATAAEEWNAVVGFWIEAELELGSWYELEAEEPLPLLGNRMVPYVYEFAATRRLPCREAHPEPRCVELILRSAPESGAIAAVLEGFLAGLLSEAGEGVPPLSYRDLSIVNEIVLVTEPRGLVPHRVSMRQDVAAVMEVAGEEQEGGQTRIRVHRYTYR